MRKPLKQKMMDQKGEPPVDNSRKHACDRAQELLDFARGKRK